MKKLLAFLLLLLCMTAACAESAEPTPTPDSVVEGGYTAPATPTPVPTPEPPPLREDPMLLNAVEIAHRIDILAENERFRYFYMNPLMLDQDIEALSYGDHTRPTRAFHLNGQTLIEGLYAGADASQMHDFTRPELRRDLVGELPELLWGRREEAELHVLYMLGRCKVFALEGAEGCGVFFLLFEEAAPVMVTWVADNDCVNVTAVFMPEEKLAAVSNAEEMSAWFAQKGMPVVTFEEVPLT